MKKNLLLLLLPFLAAACAAPPSPVARAPMVTSTRWADAPTPELFIPSEPIFTPRPVLIEGAQFLDSFSYQGWDALDGRVTPAQINAAVAQTEGNSPLRVEQKVINGFLLSAEEQTGGQVFSVLLPAQVEGGKLVLLTVKNVKQTPVLATHAILLEDYFALNFPAEFSRWQVQSAAEADLKYAAILTVTWATKYGPLRISYKTSGKYVVEAAQYPGRLDFLRLCMFESTWEHYFADGSLKKNWYPAPLAGLSATTPQGKSGEMKSDAFGWVPMRDFAAAEEKTLADVAAQVNGLPIESAETLAFLQSQFDRAFFPVHCQEVPVR